MAKCPTVQTAFCGNPIYSSCICMAWTYLIIDIIMFMVSLVLLIITIIHFRMEGEKAVFSASTDGDWLGQVSELSLSYALTNVIMCVSWIFVRGGLFLGLYKESVSVLMFWCYLSITMMVLQLVLDGALSLLLMASPQLSDVAFVLGTGLIIVQLVLYVDCHLYLTLVAYSVKELVRRKLQAMHARRLSPSRIAKARRQLSIDGRAVALPAPASSPAPALAAALGFGGHYRAV